MLEIRRSSIFAQILAKENISVILNPEQSTASFDMENRVMSLPPWECTQEVENFLCSHETGHAKYTPSEQWKAAILRRPKEEQIIYQNVLNVCEDARVDRKVMQSYPGMKRWYYAGYKEIHKKDFLGTSKFLEKPVDKQGIVNRLNIYFKTYLVEKVVTPTVEEQSYINRLNKAQGFAEVVAIADELFEKVKNEEDCVKSIETYELCIQGLVEKEISVKEIPNDIPRVIEDWHPSESSGRPSTSNIDRVRGINQPALSHLITEFLRHQRAKESLRELEDKTGVLDMKRISLYQTVDDIFLTRTILPTGQNHGFVMLIDLSQSMDDIINQVYEQVYILILFCVRLNIPFVVYGFTDSSHFKLKASPFGDYALLKLASSDMRIRDIDIAFNSLLTCQVTLSGTPLSAALSQMPKLINQFQTRHRIDQMRFVLLSDGDCNVKRTVDKGSSLISDKRTGVTLLNKESFKGRNDFSYALLALIKETTGARISNFFFLNGTLSSVVRDLTKRGKSHKKIQNGLHFITDIGGYDDLFLVDSNVVFNQKTPLSKLSLMRRLGERFG